MRKGGFAFAGLVLALTFAGSAFANHPGGGGAPIGASMTGAQECNAVGVCGLGDSDGSGTFIARVNPGQGELCYELTVSGIAPANAAHIHLAPAGVSGPVVVPLTAPTSGSSAACTSVPRELAKAIIKNPENYYVNVHNPAFPGGAVRGQLGHVAPGRT